MGKNKKKENIDYEIIFNLMQEAEILIKESQKIRKNIIRENKKVS